jgi:hypothetical protein
VLDAYHRVLGRGQISEYLKVYCSLWVLDLDRRSGEAQDPLAQSFLAGVHGAKWYAELARWATGHETEAELLARADTPAKKAEASFYRALRRFEDGHADEGRALLKAVIDTQMMAFFEYDMASYYLRHPPETKQPVATP